LCLVRHAAMAGLFLVPASHGRFIL